MSMSSMKAQIATSMLGGANSAYLEAQYELYLKNPDGI
jgi:2-oxoglutarate dehydrogenase complex dehydrogenase (E1) component-like enzyme